MNWHQTVDDRNEHLRMKLLYQQKTDWDVMLLHRWCLDVRGVLHVRTLHRHTLETSVRVHTQLVCTAVVHPGFTLVDVWGQKASRVTNTHLISKPLTDRLSVDLWPVQLRSSLARSYPAGQKQWKLPGVFTHWWTQSRPGWPRGNRRHSSISETQTVSSVIYTSASAAEASLLQRQEAPSLAVLNESIIL